MIAEQLVPAAYAVTAEQSPHRGRADLVAHCLAVSDWLTRACDENGLWYRQQGVGDLNVNRFTLGPLLDAVHMLQALPAGREARPRWTDKLERALDRQRRAFRGEFASEWVHSQVKYPNQDVYWTGVSLGQALPEQFVVRDDNIRGVRGRAGSWYIGVCQGRGLRNTFVGGLVTSPIQTQPLLAAFRGAGSTYSSTPFEVPVKHRSWDASDSCNWHMSVCLPGTPTYTLDSFCLSRSSPIARLRLSDRAAARSAPAGSGPSEWQYVRREPIRPGNACLPLPFAPIFRVYLLENGSCSKRTA